MYSLDWIVLLSFECFIARSVLLYVLKSALNVNCNLAFGAIAAMNLLLSCAYNIFN